MTHFNNDWDLLLKSEIEKPYMDELRSFLNEEYKQFTVYPPKKDLLSAFAITPYADVKVVILGQDPYHEPNQAHGLSFSVREGNPLPPSLRNIFKEINATLGTSVPPNGDLTRWARQGVLLLNSVLTVRQGAAGSHRQKGWEQFTSHVISLLNERENPIIFLLWGADAKKKEEIITNKHHIILKAAHPSPLSAHNGFFGCDHFRLANEALNNMSKDEIVW